MKFSEYVEGALIAANEEAEEFLESLREEEDNSYYGESFGELDLFNDIEDDFFEGTFDNYGYEEDDDDYSDFVESTEDDGDYENLLDEFTEAPKIVTRAIDAINRIIKFIREGIRKFLDMIKEKAKKLLNNLRFKKQLNDAKKVFRKAGIKVKSADLRRFAAETEKGYVQSQQIVDRVMAEFLNMTLTEKKFKKYKEDIEKIFDSCDTNINKVKEAKKDIDGGLLVDDAMKVIKNAENDPVMKALDKKLDAYQKNVKTLGRVPDKESNEDNANPTEVGALLQAVSKTIESHRGKFITFCVSAITSAVSFGATAMSPARGKDAKLALGKDVSRYTSTKDLMDISGDPDFTKFLNKQKSNSMKDAVKHGASYASPYVGTASGLVAAGTGASLARDAAKEYKRIKSQGK